MMKLEAKVARVERDKGLAMVVEMLAEKGMEVLAVSNGSVAVPIEVEGGEAFLEVVVKVPSGPRDGNGWDARQASEDYADELVAKAEKKAEADRKKAEKIARDEAKRAQKAKTEG